MGSAPPAVPPPKKSMALRMLFAGNYSGIHHRRQTPPSLVMLAQGPHNLPETLTTTVALGESIIPSQIHFLFLFVTLGHHQLPQTSLV